MKRTGQGFTLIELMVVVAVLAIFVTIGIPSFQNTIEKQRLKNAVEKVYADLSFARSQAIKSNRTQFFSFTQGANWCYGIDDTAACDCGAAGDCTVEGGNRATNATDFNNSALSSDQALILFEPRRGLPRDGDGNAIAGAFSIALGDHTAQVNMSVIGRLSICSDQSQLGYAAC